MTETDDKIYRKLQEHLDSLPIGYPRTESGVEIKILRRFFTPEEARIAINLQILPETLEKIYPRVRDLGMPIEELEKKLDIMVEKGALNFGKQDVEGGFIKYYANYPLLVGIYEAQVNQLTKEFLEEFHQYIDEGFKNEFSPVKHMPQLRTIPIGKSITPENSIATYDDMEKIIVDNLGPISLANCICREASEILGKGCSFTDSKEWCLQLGSSAKLWAEQGKARIITKEEALSKLKQAQDLGFVIQPSNSQRPYSICLCCGCCCEFLNNAMRFDKPIESIASNYYAEVDEELCSGCEVCESRCQMKAITIINAISKVNLDRCIGCGLCVPTCKDAAIKLRNKKDEIVPPRHTIAYFIDLMKKKQV